MYSRISSFIFSSFRLISSCMSCWLNCFISSSFSDVVIGVVRFDVTENAVVLCNILFGSLTMTTSGSSGKGNFDLNGLSC